jgi:hypothetical protein
MAKVSAAQRKHITDHKVKALLAARQARMLLRAKKSKHIPDKVLRQLGSLNLPPIPWVYDVILRELMRDAT